jgi:hypothetical protein
MATYEISPAHDADTERPPPVELDHIAVLVIESAYTGTSILDGADNSGHVRRFVAHDFHGIGSAWRLLLVRASAKAQAYFVAVLVVAVQIIHRASVPRGVAI